MLLNYLTLNNKIELNFFDSKDASHRNLKSLIFTSNNKMFCVIFKFLTILSYFESSMGQNRDYWNEREQFLKEEQSWMIGSKMTLNDKENIVNKILMWEKMKELEFGFNNPDQFPPAMHFFKAKPLIERSKVGAILNIVLFVDICL